MVGHGQLDAIFFADELIGIAVGTETPRGMRALVSRLDAMFPGVRLKDKLASATCHQDIVDIMCQNGMFYPMTCGTHN